MADLIQAFNGMAIPALIGAANVIVHVAPKLLDIAKTGFDWRHKQYSEARNVINSKDAGVHEVVKKSINRDLVLHTIHNIKRIPVKTIDEMVAIEHLLQRHKGLISERDVRRSYEQLRFNGSQVGFHLSFIVHGLLLLQGVMAAIMFLCLTFSAGYVADDILNGRPFGEGLSIALTIGAGFWTMLVWGPAQLGSINRVQRAIASETLTEEAAGAAETSGNDGPLS